MNSITKDGVDGVVMSISCSSSEIEDHITGDEAKVLYKLLGRIISDLEPSEKIINKINIASFCLKK
jgi:hypothetical protein